MDIKIELYDMELVKDSFEKYKEPFLNIGDTENNLMRSFKLGIAQNSTDKYDSKVVFQYKVSFEQKDKSGEDIISKSGVEYIFFFTDKSGEIIKKIESSDFSESDKEELVIYLAKVSYPYIKEHIENKYKKANLEIKLPFEFDDNK